MEPRVINNPELELKARNIRGNTWFWCDKEITRFFRKHPDFPKRHFGNIHSIYLALCEIDSDFHERKEIKGFAKSVARYSGKSGEIVGKYLFFLKEIKLVAVQQVRDSNGHFGNTHLYLSEWTDQGQLFEANKEWYLNFLNEDNPKISGLETPSIIEETDNPERLSSFPVSGFIGKQEKDPYKKKVKSFKEENINKNLEKPYVPTGQLDDTSEKVGSNKTKDKILTRKQLCFIERTKRLIDIIQSHIKINKRSKVDTWYIHLERLHSIDGVELKRIDAALDWYADNIGGDHIPECFSAETFREKFANIEAAIRRSNSNKTQSHNERLAQQQNIALGTNITHGIDDTFKDRNLPKDYEAIYYTEEEPDDAKVISYSMIVDMIKNNIPAPAKTVVSLYNRVKVLEGL
jgi:hypothetical protein